MSKCKQCKHYYSQFPEGLCSQCSSLERTEHFEPRKPEWYENKGLGRRHSMTPLIATTEEGHNVKAYDTFIDDTGQIVIRYTSGMQHYFYAETGIYIDKERMNK